MPKFFKHAFVINCKVIKLVQNEIKEICLIVLCTDFLLLTKLNMTEVAHSVTPFFLPKTVDLTGKLNLYSIIANTVKLK